jgi:hypothetical protein
MSRSVVRTSVAQDEEKPDPLVMLATSVLKRGNLTLQSSGSNKWIQQGEGARAKMWHVLQVNDEFLFEEVS